MTKKERILPLKLSKKMDKHVEALKEELGCVTDSETIRSCIRIAHEVTLREK